MSHLTMGAVNTIATFLCMDMDKIKLLNNRQGRRYGDIDLLLGGKRSDTNNNIVDSGSDCSTESKGEGYEAHSSPCGAQDMLKTPGVIEKYPIRDDLRCPDSVFTLRSGVGRILGLKDDDISCLNTPCVFLNPECRVESERPRPHIDPLFKRNLNSVSNFVTPVQRTNKIRRPKTKLVTEDEECPNTTVRVCDNAQLNINNQVNGCSSQTICHCSLPVNDVFYDCCDSCSGSQLKNNPGTERDILRRRLFPHATHPSIPQKQRRIFFSESQVYDI